MIESLFLFIGFFFGFLLGYAFFGEHQQEMLRKWEQYEQSLDNKE